jgi:hypothetical protein
VKEIKATETSATLPREIFVTSPVLAPNNFNDCAVCRTANAFCNTYEQRATLKKIYAKLLQLFRWIKTKNSRRIFKENHDVRVLRISHLRSSAHMQFLVGR